MTIDDTKTLHEKLSDDKASLLKVLRLAVNEGELDYWWERQNPPNEPPEVFRTFLKKVKGPVEATWIERESQAGPHGLLGEDECFKFEDEVSMLGIKKRYFIKGYFFNKGDRKGVCIQSFREVLKLRLMK